MINQIQIPQSKFDYQPQGITDQAILVTGGTTGIGRATAMLLAAQGARVMIFGRHQQQLDDALNDMHEVGQNVLGLTADTTNPQDLQRVFQQADQQLGQLDVLVNCAALPYNSIQDGDYTDWLYLVQANLLGYMACARYAIDRMKPRQKGHIVNVGSMSAEVREKGSSVYVATKAGIEGFSASLRKEVNPLGIKVTCVEPGGVGTDMQSATVEEQRQAEAEFKALKAEDVAATILYTLTQPPRVDVCLVQVKPFQQNI